MGEREAHREPDLSAIRWSRWLSGCFNDVTNLLRLLLHIKCACASSISEILNFATGIEANYPNIGTTIVVSRRLYVPSLRRPLVLRLKQPRIHKSRVAPEVFQYVCFSDQVRVFKVSGFPEKHDLGDVAPYFKLLSHLANSFNCSGYVHVLFSDNAGVERSPCNADLLKAGPSETDFRSNPARAGLAPRESARGAVSHLFVKNKPGERNRRDAQLDVTATRSAAVTSS